MNIQQTMNIWLVQAGTLYYAGGLPRLAENKKAFSFEFTNDEELAFPIGREDIAEELANECGGVVVTREITFKELEERMEKHDRYTKSDKEWNERNEEQIRKAFLEEKRK